MIKFQKYTQIDNSESNLIVRKSIILLIIPCLFGIISFYLFKYDLLTDRYGDSNFFILDELSRIIVPGYLTDIVFVDEERSLSYIVTTRFLFYIFSMYAVFIYFYFVIKSIRQMILANICFTRSSFFNLIVHFVVYLFLFVFRSPNHRDQTLQLQFADESGFYFLRTGIVFCIGLYSSSVLIVNITSYVCHFFIHKS